MAVQRHQIKELKSPVSRRVTSGLVADVAIDPELADLYLREYASPRRTSVWRALQRRVDRGELRADIDFGFVSDLLIGPLFMRSIAGVSHSSPAWPKGPWTSSWLPSPVNRWYPTHDRALPGDRARPVDSSSSGPARLGHVHPGFGHYPAVRIVLNKSLSMRVDPASEACVCFATIQRHTKTERVSRYRS